MRIPLQRHVFAVASKVQPAYLGCCGKVGGTVTDYANGLHAGIRVQGIACEFRETFNSILKGVDGRTEVVLEQIICK